MHPLWFCQRRHSLSQGHSLPCCQEWAWLYTLSPDSQKAPLSQRSSLCSAWSDVVWKPLVPERRPLDSVGPPVAWKMLLCFSHPAPIATQWMHPTTGTQPHIPWWILTTFPTISLLKVCLSACCFLCHSYQLPLCSLTKISIVSDVPISTEVSRFCCK